MVPVNVAVPVRKYAEMQTALSIVGKNQVARAKQRGDPALIDDRATMAKLHARACTLTKSDLIGRCILLDNSLTADDFGPNGSHSLGTATDFDANMYKQRRIHVDVVRIYAQRVCRRDMEYQDQLSEIQARLHGVRTHKLGFHINYGGLDALCVHDQHCTSSQHFRDAFVQLGEGVTASSFAPSSNSPIFEGFCAHFVRDLIGGTQYQTDQWLVFMQLLNTELSDSREGTTRPHCVCELWDTGTRAEMVRSEFAAHETNENPLCVYSGGLGTMFSCHDGGAHITKDEPTDHYRWYFNSEFVDVLLLPRLATLRRDPCRFDSKHINT